MQFSRKHWTGIAILGVTAIALTGCSGGGDGGGGGGGGDAQILTIGAVSDVTDWDPAQAHVGHLLQPYQAPYDTLILREPDGELAPMLATEWSYNDDNTVLTIELRDDVTFSDDTPFDAEAVVANFEHFKAENGRQAAQLVNLESAEAVDEFTVEATLSQADPAFTYFLSQAAGLMGSPAALDGDEIGAVPVGTGPYVMNAADTVAGSQYVFTAREDYWNDDLQKFGGVTFRVLIDTSARVNALVSGQVNAGLADARNAAQVEGAGRTLTSWQVDWSGLLLMDREGSVTPELGDVRVRQAINYALDRDALLETIQLGQGTPTSQPFGPESGAFDEELEDYYDHDPERARELLAEAGHPDGFTLPVPAIGNFEQPLAALAQQLSEVGITLQPTPVPDTEYLNELISGRFPAGLFNLFQGEAWVAINQIVSTNALYNVFDSSDPELQASIEAVQRAQSDEEIAAAAVEINRYVVEQAWFAPMFRIDQLYFTDDTVTTEPQVQMAIPSLYNFSPAT